MTASAQASTAGTSYYSATYCMLKKSLLKKWLLPPSMNTIELLLGYINPGE